MDLDPDEPAPILYAEVGSSWWPVAWGPIFALLGVLFEAWTGDQVHYFGWTLVGLALAGAAALWVQARRRVCSVQLTPAALRLGRETVPVRRIVAVGDVGAPVGARVLGGGWTAPRHTIELPIRLDDDSVVLAWARDPDALCGALRPLVRG